MPLKDLFLIVGPNDRAKPKGVYLVGLMGSENCLTLRKAIVEKQLT